jgi:hypothetical protein
MRTITIELDDKSLAGKRFLSFLKTLGYVSVVSKRSKKKPYLSQKKKTYTALDFLNEWSGAFKNINDEDIDKVKYDYLIQKHK